jgi:DNA-binding transcriptional ArsR family regulator
MVNYSLALDNTFSALASPVRRGMLAQLADGWASVTELSAPYDVSAPAISKHLRILEGAGLIERQKLGRVHYCRLRPQQVQDAAEWLGFYRDFWESQFKSLAEYLDEEENNG